MKMAHSAGRKAVHMAKTKAQRGRPRIIEARTTVGLTEEGKEALRFLKRLDPGTSQNGHVNAALTRRAVALGWKGGER